MDKCGSVGGGVRRLDTIPLRTSKSNKFGNVSEVLIEFTTLTNTGF